jgi:hypothetical protein
MKRALIAFFVASVVTTLSGCLRDQVVANGNGPQGPVAQRDGQVMPCGWFQRGDGPPKVCPRCGGNHCRPAVANHQAPPAGPPTGQVTYPYYTLRGPRDFLQTVPTPIGP